MKMYEDVYFHKTTRGVQHLVRDIITSFADRAGIAADEVRKQKLFRYLLSRGKKPKIDTFINLDDSSFQHAIHCIAEGRFGISTKLAQRYFKRDLYKCIELPTSSSGKLRMTLAARFVEALKQEKIRYIDDVVSPKSYKQYAVMDKNFLKNIIVKKGAEHEPLGAVSEIVNNLADTRVRLYFSDTSERDRALGLLRKCQPN